MKEQIEIAVPRRIFVVVDSNEARKTATGHSCQTLSLSVKKQTDKNKIRKIKKI